MKENLIAGIRLPFVSVILVSFNGKKWLEKCLPSVLKTGYPNFELILVDNGSSDGSLDYIKGLYSENSKLKLIYLEKNRGWAGGNNAGIKKAEGEILVLLSNDLVVDPNWITEIVRVFNIRKDIGVLQCNVHSLWNKTEIDSGMNYLDKYGYSYGFYPSQKSCEVFFAEGMALAFKKEVIEKIGLLDEYFFMEYDDMDFCWRARLAGYKVFFAPNAVVYHAGGGTVGATYFERNPANVTQYLRNHIFTLVKNYELTNLLTTLPWVIVIETTKLLFFLINRNWKFAFATLKGFFQVMRDINLILKKRKEVQSRIRKVSDKEVMKYMVPFNPKLLLSFLSYEARCERFIIKTNPPIRGEICEELE